MGIESWWEGGFWRDKGGNCGDEDFVQYCRSDGFLSTVIGGLERRGFEDMDGFDEFLRMVVLISV